jgi:hypothetical protein
MYSCAFFKKERKKKQLAHVPRVKMMEAKAHHPVGQFAVSLLLGSCGV